MTRSVPIAVLAACLTACGGSEANSQELRFDRRPVEVGFAPAAVLVRDLDGDGHDDVAAVGEGSVAVLGGDGSGGFERRETVDAGENPVDVAAGDLDGNGETDLLIANHETRYLTLLLGHADGFAAGRRQRIEAPVSPHPHAVRIADLDGDGSLDFLVDDRDPGALLLYRGRGDGWFDPPARIVVGGDPYRGMSVADLDRDGVPDILTPNPGEIAILLGDGAGGFRPAGELRARGLRPFSVAVADVNGDGAPDVAAGSGEGGGALAVWLGDGEGGYRADASSPFPIVDGPTRMHAADVDGDGIDDLVVTSYVGDGVSILLGGADERRLVPLRVPGSPWDVAAGDFDEDGRTDLVVAAEGGGHLVLLLARDP